MIPKTPQIVIPQSLIDQYRERQERAWIDPTSICCACGGVGQTETAGRKTHLDSSRWGYLYCGDCLKADK